MNENVNRIEFDAENRATVRYGDEEATAKVQEAWSRYVKGQYGRRALRNRLAKTTQRADERIDVVTIEAALAIVESDGEKARACYERIVAIAHELLPKGFKGTLSAERGDNDLVLSAAYRLADARLATGENDDGIALLRRILAWNPDDQQGVRYRLGSDMLRAGSEGGALGYIDRYEDEYPPYRFERALIEIGRKAWSHAATTLRRGFAANPYIAGILLHDGSVPPALPIAHGRFEDRETANEYAEAYGKAWREGEALAFLNWLHNHPAVLRERAQRMHTASELQ